SRGYVWRNLALDVGHVLTYFVGHEAHHRGQIVLIARQTGHRLPNEVTGRLWWWQQKSTTETRKHGEKQKQFATDERSYAASTRAKTNHKGHEGTKNRRDPPVIADIARDREGKRRTIKNSLPQINADPRPAPRLAGAGRDRWTPDMKEKF